MEITEALVCSAAIAVLDKISEPSFLACVSKKLRSVLQLRNGYHGSWELGNSHVREVRTRFGAYDWN